MNKPPISNSSGSRAPQRALHVGWGLIQVSALPKNQLWSVVMAQKKPVHSCPCFHPQSDSQDAVLKAQFSSKAKLVNIWPGPQINQSLTRSVCPN